MGAKHPQISFFLLKMSRFTRFSQVKFFWGESCWYKTFDKFHVCHLVTSTNQTFVKIFTPVVSCTIIILTNTIITSIITITIMILIRAKDLADSYMVTWMRVADVTVLSVGALTFSSDPRFSVIHVPRYLYLYTHTICIFCVFVFSL